MGFIPNNTSPAMPDFQVYPCEKVGAQSVELSAWDAIAPKTWMTQVLFWPLEDASAFKQSYGYVREGLSRLLVDVPALLGNLTLGSTDNPRDLTINIKDGACVEFAFEDLSAVEAIPSYNDLLGSGFPTTGLKALLSPRVSLKPFLDGSPTFCAKLNHINGGAALGMGLSHVLSDGTTASMVERVWALHTTDASQGVAFRRYKTATPDEEIRNRLSTPPTLDPGVPLDHFLQVVPSEEARNHLHRDVASADEAKQKSVAIMMGYLAAVGEKPERRSFAIWKFTAEKLEDLKRAASSSSGDWISTMDALAGLFWSRIAHIQRQSTKGHQKSTCLFMINVRQRLQPPVPNDYVGNVYTPFGAECPLAELESDDAGLKAAAQSMRRANKSWSQPRWEVWLHKIMTLPEEQALDLNREVVLGKHNFSFNDYSRFPSHICDWGAPLGKVARTRYLRSAPPAGAVGIHVHPRFPDGAVEVSLPCSDALRQSLSEDAVFTRYADFVCQHP